MSPQLWGGGPIIGAETVFVCTLSCELEVGCLPNFHGYISGT